jgi:hypothetical protein
LHVIDLTREFNITLYLIDFTTGLFNMLHSIPSQLESRSNKLIKAIFENNIKEVELELKKKSKLRDDELTCLFSSISSSITREMIELLYKSKTFSEDISLSTIKFHLYIRYNPCFSINEFIDKSDLNLKRSSLGSPMKLLSKHYINIPFVEFLIKNGVEERPIFLFWRNEPSYFDHINL